MGGDPTGVGMWERFPNLDRITIIRNEQEIESEASPKGRVAGSQTQQ